MLLEFVFSVVLMASFVPVNNPNHVAVALLFESKSNCFLPFPLSFWGSNVVMHHEIELFAVTFIRVIAVISQLLFLWLKSS